MEMAADFRRPNGRLGIEPRVQELRGVSRRRRGKGLRLPGAPAQVEQGTPALAGGRGCAFYAARPESRPRPESDALFLRMQNQLLHPPVEQLRDVEHVLRRAGDLVDPAELPQLLAGFAEHSEHLPLEG